MLLMFCVSLVFTTGCGEDDRSFVTKTVGVGEDVTLTCSRNPRSGGLIFWYKLVSGKLPEVLGVTYSFNHATFSKTSRITAKQGPGTFILHITQTKLSDTAFYYCEQIFERRTTFRNITFLAVKGPEPDVTTVIQEVPSDPVHPGDPVTLECSVLSDSKKKTCPGVPRVLWFRAGLHESHPSLIYVHANSSGDCERSAESHSSQKCVYSFSQDVTSSDTGTYYCAVATCGEILFGNGTKLDIEASNIRPFDDCVKTTKCQFLLFAVLVTSVFVVAFLICVIRKRERDSLNDAPYSNAVRVVSYRHHQQIHEDTQIYSAVTFTVMKTGSDGKRNAETMERERLNAAVKAFGSD